MEIRSIAPALFLLAGALPCFADEPAPAPDSLWKPSYHRFDENDGLVSGIYAFTLVTGALTLHPEESGLRGGILFDEGLRDWLRSDSESGRQRAQDASYHMQNILAVLPFAVDTLALAGLYHQDADLVWQTAAINTQAFLLSGAITLISKNISSRERPYVAECAGGSCGGAGRNKSFISGHAAAAFTGAGLICAHHEALGLFENSWLDGMMCIAAASAAAVSSVLRLSSDEHYATDVVAGAAVGILSGYILPKLIYYGGFEGDPSED